MTNLQISTGDHVSFAHRLLWDSAQRHIRIAAGQPPDDAWLLHLSAGLLAAASFEAYLNYVGGEILPEVWSDERRYFSSGQYRGTNGKLKRIAEEVGWPLPRRDRRPLSGVIELQALRDKMVHARPKKSTYRQVHKKGEWPDLPSTWLYREAPARRVLKLISDVETLAVSLNNSVLGSEFGDLVFGVHPFIGIVGFATHSSIERVA